MKFIFTHITLILIFGILRINTFSFILPVSFLFSGQISTTNNQSHKTELGYFNINVQNNNATINWSTIKENNTSIFLLERSINGGKFSTLKKLNCSNSSSTGSIYKYYDQNLTSGVYYYKLTEINADDESIIHTISVLNLPQEKNICYFSSEANPCVGKCTVLFSKCPELKTKINGVFILDAFGNKVFSAFEKKQDTKMQVLSDKNNHLKPAVFIVRYPLQKEKI